MDPSDPRHGSHPSQSIPDAAYPDDSPYRPGDSINNTPTLNPPQIIIPQPQGPSTSSSSLPQQAYSPPHAGSPFYSNPSSPNSVPSPWQQHQSTTPTSLHPHDIPSSPPPPYDPVQPPAIYSPLEPVRSHHHNPTPPGSSHYGSAPTPWPAAPAPAAYQQQQQQQAPLSPNPYSSTPGSSVNGGVGGAYKLGPVAAARARRRRKLQMCAVALCLTLLFMLALIIGILMGVVKVQWKNNRDNDD